MRNALNAMVWEGLTDNQAAVRTKLNVTTIRQALKTSHVQAYYRDQLQVRRERERSRNIHRLCEIRDAANNMPAVNAIKVLEQVADDDNASGKRSVVAGFTIINNYAPTNPLTARDVTNEASLVEENE
jgi:Neuraminidase (sialidase)